MTTSSYHELGLDGAIAPSAAEFARLAGDRRVIPVCRKVLADGMTPISVYRALADERPGTFLLESAEQGGQWTRFSFIGVASAAALMSTPILAAFDLIALALEHRSVRALRPGVEVGDNRRR